MTQIIDYYNRCLIHLFLLGKILLWATIILSTTSCAIRQIPPLSYVPKLGKEKEVSTLEVLAEALHDKNVYFRAQAVDLLGVLSKEPDEELQKHVAKILGRAIKDEDAGVRLQAIELLGLMDPKYSNEYLHAALRDSNSIIREKVMEVLKARYGVFNLSEKSINVEKLKIAVENDVAVKIRPPSGG